MRWPLLPFLVLTLCRPSSAIVNSCDICGRRPSVHKHGSNVQIADGANALPGAWPWVVSLQLPTLTGHQHTCGGSLVTAQWVLTAAHCFRNKRNLPHWRAVVGAWNLSDLGSEVHVRFVKQVVLHELYQPGPAANDVALLELDQPVKCSKYIQPACVPDSSVWLTELTDCYISGWGITKESVTSLSDVLQESRVNRISVETCNSSSWYNGNIQKHNLCAGYKEGGIDTCQGDSGGPLMCREEDMPPFWVIGLTSWGQGCAKPQKPGVYTSTQYFYGWIKQWAGPLPQPPPLPLPQSPPAPTPAPKQLNLTTVYVTTQTTPHPISWAHFHTKITTKISHMTPSPNQTTESTTPKTKAPTQTTESTTPKPETPTLTTKSTTPKTEAPTQTTERITLKTEAPTPTTESTTPQTKAPTPTTERTTPQTEALAQTTESTIPQTEAPTQITEITTLETEAPTLTTEITTHITEAPETTESTTHKTKAPTHTTESTTHKTEAPTQTTEITTLETEAPTLTTEITTHITEAPETTESTTHKTKTPTHTTESTTHKTEAPTPTEESTTLEPEVPTQAESEESTTTETEGPTQSEAEGKQSTPLPTSEVEAEPICPPERPPKHEGPPEATQPPSELEPTESLLSELESMQPPMSELEPTQAPLSELKPTQPPLSELEPTQPPLSELEPMQPPMSELEPTGEPKPAYPPQHNLMPTPTPESSPKPLCQLTSKLKPESRLEALPIPQELGKPPIPLLSNRTVTSFFKMLQKLLHATRKEKGQEGPTLTEPELPTEANEPSLLGLEPLPAPTLPAEADSGSQETGHLDLPVATGCSKGINRT